MAEPAELIDILNVSVKLHHPHSGRTVMTSVLRPDMYMLLTAVQQSNRLVSLNKKIDVFEISIINKCDQN